MITKSFKKTSYECNVSSPRTRFDRYSESAEKVASIDDLITKILLHLPVSSLIRFKSVSKHWLSLISDPYFSRFCIPNPLRPSGLYIRISGLTQLCPRYTCIPLNNTSEPSPFLSCHFSPIRVLQSCNGLLFCSTFDYNRYHVYNPTIRQITTITLPSQLKLDGYHSMLLGYRTTLVFDPSRSPHYKLVHVQWLRSTNKFEMMIYSSETRLWKVGGGGDQPFNIPYRINFLNGVYLNGAVHWMSISRRTTIYLKIDDEEERLETMPMPLNPENNRYVYFGKSGGHLHLITVNYFRDNATVVYNVYEMERDCSKWCVKYQVELGEVDMNNHRIEIMGIVRGEREEDSFLVFKKFVYGIDTIRFMKYKFADKTLEMLFEIAHSSIIGNIGNVYYPSTFEYFQSLSHV